MPGLAQSLGAIARSRAVWTLTDQAVVSGGNFATQFLLGHVLAREAFGLYGVGFTIVQLLLNTQGALITAAYMVHLPKRPPDERPRYAGSTLIHQLILCVAGAIGLALGAAAAAGFGGPDGLPVILLCQAAVIAFILFREFARQLSFAGLRVGEALGLDTVFVGVQFAAIAGLAWAGQLTPGRAFLAMGLAALLAALFWRLTTRQQFQPDRRAAGEDWRAHWRFSRWIFGTSIAFTLSNMAYPWVLFAFHGTAENGVLQACMLVGFQLINPFILGLGNFLAPRTAHAVHDGGTAALAAIVRKADFLFLAVVGGFALVLWFAGGWLMDLAWAGKYTGFAPVVHYLAVGQLFFALTITANHALNALDRPHTAFQALLLASLVTWTAGVWLVWKHGAAGAAGGQALGALTALLYTRWCYARALAAHAAPETGAQEAMRNDGR